MKLFKEYNKVKKYFIKPKINFFIGKWRNDPCLPVWRRGSVITLGKYKDRYEVHDSVMIKTGTTLWTDKTGKVHEYNQYRYTATHKLPHYVDKWHCAFIRPIRKKLRKFGLGFLRPHYFLPMWTAFHIFDIDLVWKTKWSYNDIRFEFPPSFTIVFFGLSFSVWLSAPNPKDILNGEGYWLGILGMNYNNISEDKMYNALYTAGKWHTSKGTEFALCEHYIKSKYKQEYNNAIIKWNNTITDE